MKKIFYLREKLRELYMFFQSWEKLVFLLRSKVRITRYMSLKSARQMKWNEWSCIWKRVPDLNRWTLLRMNMILNVDNRKDKNLCIENYKEQECKYRAQKKNIWFNKDHKRINTKNIQSKKKFVTYMLSWKISWIHGILCKQTDKETEIWDNKSNYCFLSLKWNTRNIRKKWFKNITF